MHTSRGRSAWSAGRFLLPLLFLLACACAGSQEDALVSYAPLPPPLPTELGVPFPVAAAPVPPPAPPVAPPRRAAIRRLLFATAVEAGVNPGLVLAVAWWESGWNQSAISSTGAIGVMQVEPYTAADAGPQLLGRHADPHVLTDNVELGVAILKQNLANYHGDVIKALVAYNAGPGVAALSWRQIAPSTQAYALGIYQLARKFNEGSGPA